MMEWDGCPAAQLHHSHHQKTAVIACGSWCFISESCFILLVIIHNLSCLLRNLC
uniref:Uncharacterized protein n=1 Tax=Anguilla anguilla TaxID=7936 RepID=A0A0E9W2B1_ANGAN